MGEKIVVSLREISEHFGIGVEGARAKAKRRAAKGAWRILPQNHPADPLRIELPADEWAEGAQQEISVGTNAHPQTQAPLHEGQRREPYDISTLVELLEKLTEQSALTADRLVLAEREKGEAELRAAVAIAGKEAAETALSGARAEMETLRERLAATERQHGDVEKGHAVELERTAAAGRADAERARAELQEWRARPWWKRLAG